MLNTQQHNWVIWCSSMGLKRDILIGLGILGVLIIIVAAIVGIVILAIKAIGLLLVLGGAFLMLFFPAEAESQPHAMSKTGIVIGIILVIAGIWLILMA